MRAYITHWRHVAPVVGFVQGMRKRDVPSREKQGGTHQGKTPASTATSTSRPEAGACIAPQVEYRPRGGRPGCGKGVTHRAGVRLPSSFGQ